MPEGNFEIKKSHIEPEKPQEGEKRIEDKSVEAISKMYEQLREIEKNIREVIPQDRNFDIELQESETGINLRLRHKENGVEKNLNTFLPPQHFFGKDETFVYRRREKKVGFPENEVKFRGFLLSLFHEIGHSHEKRGHATTPWDEIKAFGSFLKKLIQYYVIALKKEIKQKGSGEEFINTVKNLGVEGLLPPWYLDKMARSKSQSERNAWAYALRSLRKLEREGFDVFSGFENVAQIRAYIAFNLFTYDIDLFMKKLYSGELKDLRQLKESPAFWKQGKKYIRDIAPSESDDISTKKEDS